MSNFDQSGNNLVRNIVWGNRSRRARTLIIAFSLALWLGLLFLSSVIPAALQVRRDIGEIEANASSLIGAPESDDNKSVGELIEKSRNSAAALHRKLWPVRAIRPLVRGLPVVGSNVNATIWISDSASSRLDAIEELALAGDDVLQLVDTLATAHNPIETLKGSHVELAVGEIAVRGTTSLEILRSQPEIEEYGRSDGILSQVQTQLERFREADRQLIDYSLLISEMASLYAVGIKSVSVGFELVEIADGGTSASGVDDLTSLLHRLNKNIDELQSEIERVEALMSTDLANLRGGHRFQSVRESIDSVEDLLVSGQGLLDVVVELSAVIESADGSFIRSPEAMQGVLAVLDDNENRLSRLSKSITTELDGLESILEANGLESLLESNAQIAGALELVEKTVDFAGIAPGLANALIRPDGSSRYLVLGQTSDELRASGGFTSSAWFVEWNDGALSGVEYVSVLDIEDLARVDKLPAPPEALYTYMDAGSLYLRDVGWSPDFPSVGAISADIVASGNWEAVDGVISITQWGLVELATALGGLNVEGEKVSGLKLMSHIRGQTDVQGTGYLVNIFEDMLDILSSKTLTTNLLNFLLTGHRSIERKDLMIYSLHEDTQRLLSRVGWTGELKNNSGDQLVIIDSNVGWTKADSFIGRSANYVLDLRDLNDPEGALSLSYEHKAAPGPRSCSDKLPTSGELNFDDLASACYWNLARIYTSVPFQLLDSSELPYQSNSTAVVTGHRVEGANSVEVAVDEIGIHTRALFAIDAGGTQELSLRYKLPSEIVEVNDDHAKYSLDLHSQAGARGRAIRVEVLLPLNYELADQHTRWDTTGDGSVSIEFFLEKDTTLTLDMIRIDP